MKTARLALENIIKDLGVDKNAIKGFTKAKKNNKIVPWFPSIEYSKLSDIKITRIIFGFWEGNLFYDIRRSGYAMVNKR